MERFVSLLQNQIDNCVSHNARVNFGNSDIFGNFSSVLRVLREG